MEMTIKSTKEEGKDYSFWAPTDGGHIRLEGPGKPGQLGDQICVGGHFSGSCLAAWGETEFKRTCRAWYRAHQRVEKIHRINSGQA